MTNTQLPDMGLNTHVLTLLYLAMFGLTLWLNPIIASILPVIGWFVGWSLVIWGAAGLDGHLKTAYGNSPTTILDPIGWINTAIAKIREKL